MIRNAIKSRLRFCLGVAMVGGAADVAAQAPFHQEVVVTAAARPVDFAKVTRTLTVISRDQIDRLPVHSIADVLRLTGAVDVRARGERGVQTDFAIRGANFGQVLVMVDGARLNDAQSGHHNGDIPVPLDAVERIEVLHGVGSSLFGADAFGGTINIITRGDVTTRSVVVQAGSFGLVSGRGQIGTARGPFRHVFAVSADRSAGFMIERGFATAGVSSRTSFGERGNLFASYLWKDFGANGFYGPAPSHERTNQTLIAADHILGRLGGWQFGSSVSYRTHGDHFLYDVRRPGMSENRHRTHAALGTVRATLGLAGSNSATVGAEGGTDWIGSTNLGDHATRRLSAFAEWRHAIGAHAQLDASLRMDRYDEFGAAWSPAVGVGLWPAPWLRIRASTGRAFRVPTFTERYYSDPANWARPEVGPERAWAGEGGVDLFVAGDWALSGTLFGRVDHDVIDWLRSSANERWRTYNIRDVDTTGVELAVSRTLPDGAFVRTGYTHLNVDATTVTQFSKYVLDYAPHSIAAAGALMIPGGIQIAPRVEYKQRARSTGTDDYVVVDFRLSRAFGKYEVRVEGTNLGNAEYQEILGVAMPGRAATISLAIR